MNWRDWIVGKAPTFEDLRKQLQNSFARVKHDVISLRRHSRRCDRSIESLEKRFNEVLREFSEIREQFTDISVKARSSVEAPETERKKRFVKFSEVSFDELSSLEKKALVLLGRLQNESVAEWLPVGELTRALYGEMDVLSKRTTVSNVLKKLSEVGLADRERRGNYWYVRITVKGFEIVKKVVNKAQFKNLSKLVS